MSEKSETSTQNGIDVNHAVDINSLKIDSTTDEDVVDPWNVASKSTKGVDYDKLIS